MKPHAFEVELSKVACFLDELKGIPFKSEWLNGTHPNVYDQSLDKKTADKMVSTLCSKLQKVNVKKYSLEMQIWWRDHKEVDAKRIQKEQTEQKKARDIKKALAKLTPYERKLLKEQ